MRPGSSKIDNNKRGDSFEDGATPRYLPLIDCNYQAIAFGPYGGGGRSKASFLNISRSYFRREARWSFVGEIFFFGLVIATVAAALVIGTGAVIHFLSLPIAA